MIISLEVGGYLFLRVQKERYPLLFRIPRQEIIASLEGWPLRDFFVCRQGFICRDPELGWLHLPGSTGDIGFGPITADEQGSRVTPGAEGPAVAASYGDSFTEGLEVDDEHTWQAQFFAQTRAKVLNFGVMGFGPDQALLYFEKNLKRGIKPPIAVLGLISESPNRLMNSYRTFYTYPAELGFGFKPVLVPDAGGYRFANFIPQTTPDHAKLMAALQEAEGADGFLPLRKTAATFPYGFWALNFLWEYGLHPMFQWPGQSAEGRRRLGWILDRFRDDAVANGIIPVVVLMPQNPAECGQANVPKFDDLHQLMSDRTRKDLVLVNVARETAAVSGPNPIPECRHYSQKTHPSAVGNRLIARAMVRALCRIPRITADPVLFSTFCEAPAEVASPKPIAGD